MREDFRFGIEEEFFLADARTRGTPRSGLAKAFHSEVARRLPDAEREMLQSQIEISTPPGTDFAVARDRLAELRSGLAGVAREHGLLVFAAGTHPVARWARQAATPAERYERLMGEFGMLGARNMVCGLHVHVEVPEPERRIDLMNRLLPFMPLLLALSASSPFWQQRRTGLASYRLAAYGELPRTGLPDLFDGETDYARYVRVLEKTGAIRDASFLWFVVRPSRRYPTLELRVADTCTRLSDAIGIAALYRCLVRLVIRKPALHHGLTGASRAIVAENLWRAQRDGFQANLIDEAEESAAPVADRLAAVLALVAEDADALGCGRALEALEDIARVGTSADRQMAILDMARSRGRSAREALSDVVDWLASATAGSTA